MSITWWNFQHLEACHGMKTQGIVGTTHFFFFFSGYHALVLWAVPPWLDLQILGIPVATSCKLVLRMKLANWFHGIVFLWGAIYLLEGLCSFSSVAIQMNLSWWDSHTFLLLVGNSRPRCLQGWFLPRSMREASSGSTPGVLPWGHSWRRPLEPQLETGPGNTTGDLPWEHHCWRPPWEHI